MTALPRHAPWVARCVTALVLGVVLLAFGMDTAAAARSETLEVTLYHEVDGSTVDLCVVDDRGDLRDATPALDELLERWPDLGATRIEEEFGCIYLEVPLARERLATGDGFRVRAEVPPLAGLAGLGYEHVVVSVCTIGVEVAAVVEPPDARIDAHACFVGYHDVGLDPSASATVSITARASDGFVLRQALVVAGMLALVAVVAGFAVLFRRRLAMRWVEAPTWRWATWGAFVGLLAGGAVFFGALGIGLLDAIELRRGFTSSLVVAIAVGLVAAAIVALATAAVARARQHPLVAAEARRRGYTSPTDEDIPAELADLLPPPPVAVPPGPWWSWVVSAGPPGLLWAAGLGALWLEEPGPLAQLAIVAGTFGALLLWLREPLIVATVRSQAIDPVRRATLMAVVKELRLPLRDVRQATVALPADHDGPALGFVVGRRLHLSPLLERVPPRRALLVALTGATEPAGLLSAWCGACALAAGAFLDLAWGGLAWWALLPVALLVPYTLRWWQLGRGAQDLDELVGPDEVVATGTEAAWRSLAQLAAEVPPDLPGDPDEPDVAAELRAVWQLSVLDAQRAEEELGATPGTALATAHQLELETIR